MQPGDLVVLSSRKTRRGMGYEDKVGLVIKIASTTVAVNFAGTTVYLDTNDVELVSESR